MDRAASHGRMRDKRCKCATLPPVVVRVSRRRVVASGRLMVNHRQLLIQADREWVLEIDHRLLNRLVPANQYFGSWSRPDHGGRRWELGAFFSKVVDPRHQHRVRQIDVFRFDQWTHT